MHQTCHSLISIDVIDAYLHMPTLLCHRKGRDCLWGSRRCCTKYEETVQNPLGNKDKDDWLTLTPWLHWSPHASGDPMSHVWASFYYRLSALSKVLCWQQLLAIFMDPDVNYSPIWMPDFWGFAWLQLWQTMQACFLSNVRSSLLSFHGSVDLILSTCRTPYPCWLNSRGRQFNLDQTAADKHVGFESG